MGNAWLSRSEAREGGGELERSAPRRRGQLCAQLLQLELGAVVQCPPPEVLAGFHRIGALGVELGT